MEHKSAMTGKTKIQIECEIPTITSTKNNIHSNPRIAIQFHTQSKLNQNSLSHTHTQEQKETMTL